MINRLYELIARMSGEQTREEATGILEALQRELAAAKKQAAKTYEQVDLEVREELSAAQADLLLADKAVDAGEKLINRLNAKLGKLKARVKC